MQKIPNIKDAIRKKIFKQLLLVRHGTSLKRRPLVL